MSRRSPLALAPFALFVAGAVWAVPATAQTTPASPAAAQPDLPTPTPAAPVKPGSPVVEGIVHNEQRPLDVRKPALVRHSRQAARHRHLVHRHGPPVEIERPALAGVELLAPAARPDEPPHVAVPMPAYPLDAVAAALTSPPPPLVCHPVRRVADLPDPHLYRERTLACEPDNP